MAVLTIKGLLRYILKSGNCYFNRKNINYKMLFFQRQYESHCNWNKRKLNYGTNLPTQTFNCKDYYFSLFEENILSSTIRKGEPLNFITCWVRLLLSRTFCDANFCAKSLTHMIPIGIVHLREVYWYHVS